MISNIVKLLAIMSFCISVFGCSENGSFHLTTKTECNNEIPFETINVPKKQGDIAFYLTDTMVKRNQMTIRFGSGFNNKIKAFINDTLVFNAILQTDTPLGLRDTSFLYDYSAMKRKDLILKVIILGKGCITTKLNLNYHFLSIDHEVNNWICTFNDNAVDYR